MPRAIWSGSISFGLVNIPVKLYTGTRDRKIHFHMLNPEDGARVQQALIDPATGEQVPRDKVVKGYEVSPGQYVVVKQEELDRLTPKTSRLIEISDFVDLDGIDPIYYEHPYYLLPEEGATNAYSLLVRAMEEKKKVGVGKFVMHNKEYLVAIRTLEGVLCLETMRFADEVVEPGELELPEVKEEPRKKELQMAEQLIDMLAEEFDPTEYRDEYMEELKKLIKSKEEGKELVTQPEVEEPGKVVDLMSALEKSLDEAKKKKKEASG